ncbi:uncharacterized protein LOC143514625 isoform X2 [Brachyhypopomus gauderio]|uniref:uncharacterized protein LOC143514625 isoform X2 n=1 Tax=Brachyhypopomus gauderio TaxID=698409 RepID=UPI004041D425
MPRVSDQAGTTAQGLKCNTCPVGIISKCFLGSAQTCTGDNNNCYTATAVFNVTGVLSMYTSGCTASTNCNNSVGSVLGAGYTITRTCCSTDLCNGADGVQLSLAAALSAALLATAWSYM